jgi:hypothetical protein
MTSAETIAYLKRLMLTEALWWFIENMSADSAEHSEVFFYLRERYRKEKQS